MAGLRITLTCANCKRQETHAWDGEFIGWLEVYATAPTQGGKPRLADLCSLYCLGFWAQHEEGFRLHRLAQGRKP